MMSQLALRAAARWEGVVDAATLYARGGGSSNYAQIVVRSEGDDLKVLRILTQHEADFSRRDQLTISSRAR